jgi:hypothetical protein
MDYTRNNTLKRRKTKMVTDVKCPRCGDEWIFDGDEGFFNEVELHEIEQHGELTTLCQPCQEESVRDM